MTRMNKMTNILAKAAMTLISAVVIAVAIPSFGFTSLAASNTSKGRATGYRASERAAMEMFWEEAFNASPDSNGMVTVRYSGSDMSKILKYGTYEYNLGSIMDTKEFSWNGNSGSFRADGKVAKAAAEHRAVEAWIAQRTAGLAPTEESVRGLFVELASSTSYDNGIHYWGANGLLNNRSGICHDYATLFNRCLQSMGIESYYVRGRVNGNSASEHAWNAFVLDGRVFTVDVCFAAAESGAEAMAKYFVEDGSMTLGGSRSVIEVY